MPGQAVRKARARRKTTDGDARHVDSLASGARTIAYDTLSMALRVGTWIAADVDGVRMVRHRDWTDPATVTPDPAPETVTVRATVTPATIRPKPAPVALVGYMVPTLDELQGVARLLTATHWERAAIVAAHVDSPGRGSRSDMASFSQVVSPNRFAALGLAGLTSKDTVRRYVQAWESTGLPRPVPGEPVTLPRSRFPTVNGDDPRRRDRASKLRIARDDPAQMWADLVRQLGPDGADAFLLALIDAAPRHLRVVGR